jgi:hypothetical protein
MSHENSDFETSWNLRFSALEPVLHQYFGLCFRQCCTRQDHAPQSQYPTKWRISVIRAHSFSDEVRRTYSWTVLSRLHGHVFSFSLTLRTNVNKSVTASNDIQQHVNSANSGDVDNDSQSDLVSLWFGQLCSRGHGTRYQPGYIGRSVIFLLICIWGPGPL